MSSDGITAASPSSLTIAKRNKFVRSPLYGHFIVLVQVMLFTLVQLKYLILICFRRLYFCLSQTRSLL
jgi:hypothetical protein